MRLELVGLLLALTANGCAQLADDGLPAPQTGERFLHDQFVRARARMTEPYVLAGEDTLLLSRTFRYQLQRLGDARFAALLSKEPLDVISAVGGFIESRIARAHPQTDRVLQSVPNIEFPAERVTAANAKLE
jgi:hypothetical protein